MYDIDTKLLRSFLSVATERSFSNAASRLGYSQATMSQRIRQLEGLLGVTLFERGYHSVVLTPGGTELLPHAQRVVDEHDNFLNRARKGQVSGNVRLGIAEDYVLPMLANLLKRVQQIYPGIELSIVTGLSRNLCQQVEARNLDLAVVTLPETKPGAHVLAEPDLKWVAAPGFRHGEGTPWPIAFFPEGCAFRAAAKKCLAEQGIAFREVLVSPSGQVIQSAAAAETAITVMALGTIPVELRPLSKSYRLPNLPRTCIQIVERDKGLSSAALQIKELVISAF
ncbi:LysR family transcriptional regulator [Rhodobacteraceae bacterium B1Z28]|uniref:LysR family transcriptional regulator n=1 Tax=Ruegeria haliotis TaxID=2747601 RepID=A0ABX2PW17_9RHOB|nr:LysR family transcriptional regulator [Ruegeria haliotis]NVO58389.1 LysR family transcriptional regulator [Ruegeria haliotis]